MPDPARHSDRDTVESVGGSTFLVSLFAKSWSIAGGAAMVGMTLSEATKFHFSVQETSPVHCGTYISTC